MATIESKELIHELLTHNGVYPGDPPAYTIWSYVPISGTREVYAVFYTPEHDMYESPYVTKPKLLWLSNEGLTIFGEDWLENEKQNRSD